MPKKIIVPEPKDGLKFIDAHCHLPFPRSKKNNRLPSDEEQFREYFMIGGIYLITSSIDNTTLELILNFVKDKQRIGFTCGWAPQTVTYTSKIQYKGNWDKWIDFIKNNKDKYLAIGEIGLDFHHAQTLEKREKQVTELKKIFEITKSFGKPYVLHVRNATELEYDRENPKHRYNKRDGATKEILNIIKDFNINPEKVMWHCFSGPDDYGIILPKQGFKLSVPSSAYGSNRWRNVTKNSPLDSLLTETDSYYQHPYLRGPINVPSNARFSIAAISYSHNVSQELVSEKTIENARKFFNLDLDD
ncbi:MAG: TatD family hydrolase [Candidatus Odinarchaeota archaeon]